MDKLRHHNLTLEDDVHNIIHRQLEVNPLEEVELIDPQSILDEIWGCLFLRVSNLSPWQSLMDTMIPMST